MTSHVESARLDRDDLREFEHHAVLFDSAEHLRRTAVPRLRSALRRGEHAVLAVADPTRDVLLAGLGAADAARVHVADHAGFYDAPGRTLAALHRRARAEHPRRVLVVGEPPLPLSEPMPLREWHRLDSALAGALAETRLGMLCLHDVRGLPEVVVRTVRRTHPVLLTPDRELASPDYTDPAVFSAADLARPLPAPTGAQLRMDITADLGALRGRFADLAARADVPGERRDDLVLAVNELAANVVEHGGGSGVVALWRRPGWVVCDVLDHGGELRDPLSGYHPADPYSPRGYGLWITRQLCDFMEIRATAQGTLIRLHLRG
ncbi:anti-sigma factor RsbA family regulatory protein [Streptomonospora nanhaiensis]|uniref:Anti-sigma regulatory factor (Ser/Thr protein kinase) n=1 Tax=Streptomonospora nanhaiensis TaxID=1323731 RepID=A0A853BRC8_9ACTN|nr:anti-sigma factor RsbA family regulatory protein [Streptomonospora nanhaiensis]MBV2364931.1 sensor histidine kinase [Streptomonospora nanhaiensis]MBX9387242.1 sensor histidine kinase [Streptomonospora nanhaiensis]NYI97550.1 anti-sigma regulatory factor (Ser/Thr protein kinase) [Streptomonospora nanhaiensis]